MIESDGEAGSGDRETVRCGEASMTRRRKGERADEQAIVDVAAAEDGGGG